jgi:hypothetical protein
MVDLFSNAVEHFGKAAAEDGGGDADVKKASCAHKKRPLTKRFRKSCTDICTIQPLRRGSDIEQLKQFARFRWTGEPPPTNAHNASVQARAAPELRSSSLKSEKNTMKQRLGV